MSALAPVYASLGLAFVGGVVSAAAATVGASALLLPQQKGRASSSSRVEERQSASFVSKLQLCASYRVRSQAPAEGARGKGTTEPHTCICCRRRRPKVLQKKHTRTRLHTLAGSLTHKRMRISAVYRSCSFARRAERQRQPLRRLRRRVRLLCEQQEERRQTDRQTQSKPQQSTLKLVQVESEGESESERESPTLAATIQCSIQPTLCSSSFVFESIRPHIDPDSFHLDWFSASL